MKISLQPTLLRWARERAGLSGDVLAQKMSVKPEKVTAWEENGELTFNQAQKLADVTHTPFGYLYLPEPPQEALPIHDFRTVGSEAVRQPSPDLLETLDQAEQIQSWFRDELLMRGQEPLTFVGSLTTDMPVEMAADRIRQVVGFEGSRNVPKW